MRYLGREENHLLALSLNELKIMYRCIWNDLKAKGTLGLDEEASDLLHELQTVLQAEASRSGVELANHSEWADFVGIDGGSCTRR